MHKHIFSKKKIGIIIITIIISMSIAPSTGGIEKSYCKGFISNKTFDPNQPPNTPSQPNGPDFEYICLSGNYSCSTTDPDGDNISYGWDWNGDLIVDEWTDWYLSGEPCIVSHFWDEPGYFSIRVKAKDIFENESGWSTPLNDTIENHLPDMPSNPFPPIGAKDVPIDVTLSWNSGDQDSCDTVIYEIYLGTTCPPPYIDTIGPYPATQTFIEYNPDPLDYYTAYNWRVVAVDNHNESTEGSVSYFTTVQENHPPYEPSDPHPPDNATNVTDGISWTGGDPDPGDIVTYDVYFGTTNPPPLIITGLSETSCDPGIMTPYTHYFWKIVAWDNHGTSTAGPIWTFTTGKPNPPITTHEFNGTLGDNGWYVSDVSIHLSVENDAGVDATYLSFDGVTFDMYIGPILVNDDAEHQLWYYSVDIFGQEEELKGPFPFKIDQTLPTINLTVEKQGFNSWLLIASVEDKTSGIRKVEFYLNDELLGEITGPPFEFIWTGFGSHEVHAIAYDSAGNSQMSNLITPIILSKQHAHYLYSQRVVKQYL
jgi:hypothetical protein